MLFEAPQSPEDYPKRMCGIGLQKQLVASHSPYWYQCSNHEAIEVRYAGQLKTSSGVMIYFRTADVGGCHPSFNKIDFVDGKD